MSKLYRVDRVQSTEALYCGYDREDAIRTYYQSSIYDSRYCSPGQYGYRTEFLHLDPDQVKDEDVERTEMEECEIED